MSNAKDTAGPAWAPAAVLGLWNPEAQGWSCMGRTQAGRRCRRFLSQTMRDEGLNLVSLLSPARPADRDMERKILARLSASCLCYDHDDAATARALVARWESSLEKARSVDESPQPSKIATPSRLPGTQAPKLLTASPMTTPRESNGPTKTESPNSTAGKSEKSATVFDWSRAFTSPNPPRRQPSSGSRNVTPKAKFEIYDMSFDYAKALGAPGTPGGGSRSINDEGTSNTASNSPHMFGSASRTSISQHAKLAGSTTSTPSRRSPAVSPAGAASKQLQEDVVKLELSIGTLHISVEEKAQRPDERVKDSQASMADASKQESSSDKKPAFVFTFGTNA